MIPTTLPGGMPAQRFFQDYWQKRPLLLRGACGNFVDPVDAGDLTALASEEAVGSRLVVCIGEPVDWLVEHGPFCENRFEALPASHWSLLVHAVDQFLPDVARLLEHFQWLPRWRLDDVMVSYATRGGGVGPHYDHYDVFLLQGKGTRKWQVGQRCSADTVELDHPNLKLLAGFAVAEEFELVNGDLLYVPSEFAHWGICASDECITYSIGFRAPSQQEVLHEAIDIVTESLSEHHRYRDPGRCFDTDRFCIDATVTDELDALYTHLHPDTVKQALARAFGQQVTEPRHPELIDRQQGLSTDSLNKMLAAGEPLNIEHHRASRLAYRTLAEGAELFVDGECFLTTTALAEGICNAHITATELRTPQARQLLRQLVNQGSVKLRIE